MNNQLTLNIQKTTITKENILEIIDNKIKENAQKADLYMCRLVLFQYFQIKYKNNKNLDYVGYILYGMPTTDPKTKLKKMIYTLDVTDIGTLCNAGVLSEINEIDYNDNFYNLLTEFYSEQQLNDKFTLIANKNTINLSSQITTKQKFECLKNINSNLFRTYERKVLNKDGTVSRRRRFKSDAYFYFRFFRLSDEFLPHEQILWEALKEQFPHRLMIPLVRGR